MLGALLAVVVAGCSSSTDDELVAGPGDLGHIHDLALDDDGTLLVASHLGLYRIEGIDRAVLIGSARHDLMSMTRLDGGELIASGHPDLRAEEYRRDGLPPHFGLVESTDGGQTWTSMGGLGENDFHALAPTDAGVYAAEAATGSIWLLGADGAWEERGPLEARDLAVDPADSDRQIATGLEGGVWVSDDGANSWDQLANGPPLVEVDWLATGQLVGIDDNGTVWTTSSRNGVWDEVAGGPAEPETLFVADEASWWVTTHGGYITGTDNAGDDWREVYLPPDEP